MCDCTSYSIFGVVFLTVVFVCALSVSMVRRIRQQWKCTHDIVFENAKHDVICSECGRNFGFVVFWKNKHPTRKVTNLFNVPLL